MKLSAEQLDRHKRHILLKEIGGPGVQKLQAAGVTLIGAGALGGPCAMYLAAAGVGSIEIFDNDEVDRSNLQRQIQFGDEDTGASKAERLAARLVAIDPSLNITSHVQRYDGGQDLSGSILIDATDNYEARYLINQQAHEDKKPMVHGAAAGWTGQVSVFESGLRMDAPCYQCWVPEKPPDAQACDEVGVVGAVTGLVGTHMALEVIKLITGAGTPLYDHILLIDGLHGMHRRIKLSKDSLCQTCAL